MSTQLRKPFRNKLALGTLVFATGVWMVHVDVAGAEPPRHATFARRGPAPLSPPGALREVPSIADEQPDATHVRLSLRDALLSTLQNHPAIASARNEVTARAADVLAARAPFDPTLQSELGHSHETQYLLPAERYAPTERSLQNDTTSFSVGGSARFLWGTQLAPSLTLERVKQSRNPNAVGLPTDPAQRARVEVKLLQPLLRGRGAISGGAELRAAERARSAAEHAAAHTAQARVFETIVAYYKLAAANDDVAAFEASVARATQLLEETGLLVEAEHRTRADLRQVQASLDNQTSMLIAAQDELALARSELALAMGLDGRAIPSWLPADAFPDTRAEPPALPQLMAAALSSRRDLRSVRETLAAAGILLAGAERDTLPALDLGVSVGYVGALDREGVGPFFSALGSNVPGVNAGASLRLELPLQNAAARAARDQRKAEQRAALIAQADLLRQVRTRLQSARNDLQLSAAALAASERALQVLQVLVQDERDKLREGLSTVIDVVITEERLTQAALTCSARRLRYAAARARLQFERGALPERQAALAPTPAALFSLEVPHG